MLVHRNGSYVSALILAAVLSGCSGGPSETSDAPATATAETGALATLELSGGHKVVFFDAGTGYAIGEGFEAGREPVWQVTDETADLSIVEVYKRLAPAGAVVPAAILEAEARYRSAAQQAEVEGASVVAPPPAAVDERGEGPAFYSEEELQQFMSTHCRDELFAVKCIPAIGSVNWGHVLTKRFRAKGFVETGGYLSVLQVFRWDGAQDVLAAQGLLGNGMMWQLSVTMPTATWWRAWLGDAGPFRVGLVLANNFPIKG